MTSSQHYFKAVIITLIVKCIKPKLEKKKGKNQDVKPAWNREERTQEHGRGRNGKGKDVLRHMHSAPPFFTLEGCFDVTDEKSAIIKHYMLRHTFVQNAFHAIQTILRYANGLKNTWAPHILRLARYGRLALPGTSP